MITENVSITSEYSWVDIEGPLPGDKEFLHQEFKLSPLLIQDCLRPDHLPKYERTLNGHFIMGRAFNHMSLISDISMLKLTHQFALFITEDRLVSIHDGKVLLLRKIIHSEDQAPAPNIRVLAHQILKSLIGTYDAAVSILQTHYEKIEYTVLTSKEILSNGLVYEFRRKLFVLKGVLKLFQNSLHSGRQFFHEDTALLQDLEETIEQLYFRFDNISNNFDQLFAIYLTINDQKNNEVMRILTVFASIMLPLTFIASFYGMNFEYLPGLHSRAGLIGILSVMVTSTFFTIWYFNRKNWFPALKKSS